MRAPYVVAGGARRAVPILAEAARGGAVRGCPQAVDAPGPLVGRSARMMGDDVEVQDLRRTKARLLCLAVRRPSDAAATVRSPASTIGDIRPK
ncbi:hypothetical protein Nans01_12390 [Nocardiopsis ansamitocini]|uniref:Uncharacterized protein n=1 Tax=Nocardiopsis ansamitocini TaxID=1670832 RepID=A0A9W6P4D3_9ACTN|nr:hypothetical protein Nans01_12390 [Nocardiopsis ansamitocini]